MDAKQIDHVFFKLRESLQRASESVQEFIEVLDENAKHAETVNPEHYRTTRTRLAKAETEMLYSIVVLDRANKQRTREHK